MSSYGSSPSNLNNTNTTNVTSSSTSSSSTSSSSTSSSSTSSSFTNLNVTSNRGVYSPSSVNINSTTSIGLTNVTPPPSTPSSQRSQTLRSTTQYPHQVTLQYSTKTNFAYDQSDKYFDDAITPYKEESQTDDQTPEYKEDETYGIETKTIYWTIGSNEAFSYGYHLDGTPYVHDNSNIPGGNGGLYLVSTTDSDGGPRTEFNAWYEPVEISRTAINPDNAKLPSEHIGQMSRGAQEGDISFTYDPDAPEGSRHNIEIELKPWIGISDYHYGSIPAGRGYNDGDYSSESNSNPPLNGIPGISERNTEQNAGNNYGTGLFSQSYVYPNYYDGRGQMITTGLNQLPRDQVLDANVDKASDDTINPGNEGWIAAYRDAPRSTDEPAIPGILSTGAPWLTEGQWLTIEEVVDNNYYGEGKSNTTGYNYLTVIEGVRGNRWAPGTGSLPPTAAYDFAVANSGMIKDRDDIERWSGQYNYEDNSGDPYQLKANDLIVTQASHWDHRGVEQMRKYCRQRYELYTLMKAEYTSATLMDSDDWATANFDIDIRDNGKLEKFNWYRFDGKFPVFPISFMKNGTEIEFEITDTFDDLIKDNQDLYGSLPVNDASEGGPGATTFREYAEAVTNDYSAGGLDNKIDPYKGWGHLCSKWDRYPFIDMTACLSVVPPIELIGDIAAADFDQSGQVDGDDLLQILANWGTTPKDENWRPELDLNGDGIVDAADLTILLDAWQNQGGSVLDYSKTFRPPLNWDPTDRGSVPYITEIDNIEDYTIDGPGAKPLAEGINPATDIPVGQIGYPNKAIDGGTAQAWEIYTADPNQGTYKANDYPSGLQMSLTDTYWPELKIASKEELRGDGDPNDPTTWDFESTVRRAQGLGKAPAKYLRLGGHILWHTAAESDNRVQGCHGGYDLSLSNYGSQEGCEYELLSMLAFDRNLDPENLNSADRNTNKNISPSISWIREHYGTDWDLKPDPNSTNGDLIAKRDNFSLRQVIRRALTQRGIDIYGGQRSGGKYIVHNAGHTDWWDVVAIIGLSCTQHEDWVDMLNTGSMGSKKTGTLKNFSHQIPKTDENGDPNQDYTYGEMNNVGTFPGDIGHMGAEGMSNLTNVPGSHKQGNGLGAYTHNSLRFKDLSVKTVNDFTIIPYPDDTGESINLFPGKPIRPENLPNVFPNQLITVYPPVGGQCGNQIDNLYYRLKEIVDADKVDTERTDADIRDRSWRGLYTQNIQNSDSTIEHVKGDDVTTWVGTDTKDKPWGSPAPMPDQPLNNLQSGVEPEWVAETDEPHSFLVGVSTENLVRYDDQFFNIMRVKLDENGNEQLDENGNRVFETNGNYYRPHKELWRHIEEDFRPINRWEFDDGDGVCDDSYALQYTLRALDDATQEDTKYAPLNGIYPRGYDPIKGGNNKHWGLLTNQDYMSSNYHRGLYVKNTTMELDATGVLVEGPRYGEISVILASITEHVRNSECVKVSAVGTKPRIIDTVNAMNPGASSVQLEGGRESISGKNDNTDLGPTARAMNFLLLDDIGLKEDLDAGRNVTVDIAHNLEVDFEDPDVPMPSVNSWANGGGYGNVASFGGFKSYDYVYNRGAFSFGMAARMFTGIKDEDKQDSTKVRHKPLSVILDALPAYYAKLFVKYPTFWNNPLGRSITEEDTNSLHSIFLGGNSQGVGWSDGRSDVKLANHQDRGDPNDNVKDNFYGGDQWPELIRALFNQELLGRISGKGGVGDDDETQVASQWRDPSNGRKWCVTMKEKLWRWKNEAGVIGKVMSTKDGKLDFSDEEVIQISDPPENITALARSVQGKDILFDDFTYTFDTLDGQQASMAKNNSRQTGSNFTGTVPTTEIADDFPNAYIPEWVTHLRVFNKNGDDYAGEKTNFATPAGLEVQFTVLGKNRKNADTPDLDERPGRPIQNGGVSDAEGNNDDNSDDNRNIAATDEEYDLYLDNDGFHIRSSPGGALPYKQFVKGKSLYVWSHGTNRWQELVLVSEDVNVGAGEKITSHGPRSGATKGEDNDYSDTGFVDDPIEWEQVWVLPNETQVLPGEEGDPKALAVWANLANSFNFDGLRWLTVFYADPTTTIE